MKGVPKFKLAAVVLAGMLVAASIFSISDQVVYADSCLLLLTQPGLKSLFSRIADAAAGDQYVIATSITTCVAENRPFVVIIEVRNSEGITEYLGWQSGDLEGLGDSAEIGLSWVPVHGDNYELRTFAISGFENPLILSPVMTSSASISESPGSVVVAIPQDPDPATQSMTFEPPVLKLVLGVNSTVVWTNGDNVSHRLIGDPDFPNYRAFDGKQVFLYPGDSFRYVFTQAGSYFYIDRDRGWMRGIVYVIPHDAVNAYLNFSINGLKDSYKLSQSEPIEFSLDISGFETGCGAFLILVERIDEGGTENPFVWSWGGVYDCFNVATPYRNFSLHFPPPDDGPVYQVPINQTGTYRLTASFDMDYTSAHYSISDEFQVTQ